MKKAKGNFDLLLKVKKEKNKKKKLNQKDFLSEQKEIKKDLKLDKLSYRELQDLAQENDIQANQKTDELIEQLREAL